MRTRWFGTPWALALLVGGAGSGTACLGTEDAHAIEAGTSTGPGEDEPPMPAAPAPGASSSGTTSGDEGGHAGDGYGSGSGGGSGGSDDTDGSDAAKAVDPGPPFELAALDAPHGSVPGARGPGQAWGDIDGDGWLDLVTIGGSQPSRVWHNRGDGSFALDPATADLAPYGLAVGATMADYDNDGDPDLYLSCRGPNVLLRNDGGHFVDVTEAAGVGDPAWSSSVAWGDYDGDGWLDLYVANTGTSEDTLHHANGDGSFSEASHLLPGRGAFQAYAVTLADLDGDGDVDLYVGNDKYAGNQAWRNDGSGCEGWCFSNVSEAWGANIEIESMGVAVGDYDNDLDLDLSVTDNHTHHVLSNALDRGGLVDVSAEAGVVFDAFGWGTVWLDYDADGWLDLFVADGNLDPGFANRMFHNEGGTLSDASASSGCIEPGWGMGVSTADYDHDGAIDLVVGNRGTRHDLFHNRNPSGHHWLTLELRGGGPVNRDAVGSRVWLTTTGGTVLMRDVVLGSGMVSSSSLRLHFGLGDEGVGSIVVRWPDGTMHEPPVPATDGLWVLEYPGA